MQTESALDRAIGVFDHALRASTGVLASAGRENPAASRPHIDMNDDDRAQAIRLMRVNHAGEVAAQALYAGQALGATQPELRDTLKTAAQEEADHLSWCVQRLAELGGETSKLGPVWFAGSFALGAAAGRAGDAWSLGFVAETERQVSDHLTSHLQQLPAQDHRSRAILSQMREDEQGHASQAQALGARPLPPALRAVMRLTAKIMTTGARWI